MRGTGRALLFLTGFSLALSGASATAAVAAEGRAPSSDRAITAKVRASLAADPRLKGRTVTVETVRGTVALHGTVDSAATKTAAAKVAARVPGVRDVRNEITNRDESRERSLLSALLLFAVLRQKGTPAGRWERPGEGPGPEVDAGHIETRVAKRPGSDPVAPGGKPDRRVAGGRSGPGSTP